MVWVLGVLTAVATLWCGFALYVLIGSQLAGADGDPHGYATIFSVLMLAVGLPVLLVVAPPFVRRVRRRGQ